MLRSAPVRLVHGAGRLAADAVGAAATVAATGAVRPVRPDRLVRAGVALARHGGSPAGAAEVGAALWPRRAAVIDERGTLTHAELDADARALAAAMHADGLLGPGRRVGVLCRNHRGFLQAALAAARGGADLVPLNTEFAGPQLAAVLAREQVDVVVHDEEFDAAFGATEDAAPRVLAWHDGDAAGRETVAALIARGRGLPDAPHPARPGRTILLTSGSTGTPKGATRSVSLNPVTVVAAIPGTLATAARFRPVPRAGMPVLVAPPLFHMYGLGVAMAGLAAGSPLVLQRRFDPEGTLAAVERHRVGVLCVVPTMLKRIMDLPPEVRDRHDTSSLRLVSCGAAPLSPQLATAFMDAFGDVLFNGYGSTEVGGVSLATPADMRAAPGTLGRAAPGVTLRILDDAGRPVPTGTTGRIFVGGAQRFDGYTGGDGGKEVVDGLVSTGDVGHLDAEGRLFLDGRDDEMIVSGGENVFPQEVEAVLAAHPAIADAGAVGVADPDFGQRLVAFVVAKDGATVTEDELKAHVRAHLARFKVPRSIRVVDALPRNTTGKIRRAGLRALADRDDAG